MKHSKNASIRYYLGRFVRLCIVVCSSGLGLAPAFAAVDLNKHPPNPGLMPGGGWEWSANSNWADPPRRTWSGSSAAGAARVVATDAVTIAAKAGPMVVNASRSVTAAEAAAAIVRCAFAGGPICAAGTAAAIWAAAEYGIDNSKSPNNYDPGTPPVSAGYYCLSFANRPESCAPSPTGALLAAMEHDISYSNRTFVRYKEDPKCNPSATGNNFSCSVSYLYTVGTGSMVYGPQMISGVAKPTDTVVNCPPIVDFENPAYSRPAHKRSDGKCETGRYSGNISQGDAEAKTRASPPSTASPDLVNVFGGVIDSGGAVASSDITSTGPASQTTPTVKSTTTDSTGTTVTEISTVYEYTYPDDRIEVIEREKVKVTKPDGTVSETGTETPGGKPDTKVEVRDPCLDNPDRVGCTNMGTAPNDKVPAKTKDLSWNEETVNLPYACPEDASLTMLGKVYAVSYAPMCDAAQKASPFIRAGGAFAALMLLLAAVRQL